MSKIKRTYFPFLKAGIQGMIIYRLNFLGFVIGGLVYCFVMFYLWKAVFESAGGEMFMGFTMAEMVVFLFLSNTTSQIAYSSVSADIGEEIRDGSISMRLLKPVNTDWSYLFEGLGAAFIKLFVLLLPVLAGLEIYRSCETGSVQFAVTNCLLYLLSLILAYIISFRVNLCFGFMAFYVKNLWGFNILKNSILSFLSGSLIPLAFLPGPVRLVLEYMPFASMSYTPVMLYLGKYDYNEACLRILIQIIWAAAIFGLSKLIWRGAVRKLAVQGG